MGHYQKAWRLSVFVLLLMNSVNLNAQERSIITQEASITALEKKLDSLQLEQAQLLNQAEIVAHRIELYRTKQSLNAREHRNFQKQMQASQELEHQIRHIDSLINETDQERHGTIENLVQYYEKEINRLLELTEKDEVSKNQDLFTQIQGLLSKKQIWENQLVIPIPRFESRFEIDARPWDTPSQLQIKGDFLLDREEAFREEIELVKKRVRSLAEEKNIRVKVAELAHDLDLFDEREELFGRQQGAGDQSANVLSYWEETGNRATDAQKQAGTETWNPDITQPSLNENVEPIHRGISPRSPEYIQDSIERLESYVHRMQARADSLNQKAVWFHSESKKRSK